MPRLHSWASIGDFAPLSSPITLISIDLNNLADGAMAVGTPFTNSAGVMFGDLELDAGDSYSPPANGFVEVWLLRSIDSGVTFEDGSATVVPGRPCDAVIPVSAGVGVIPVSGMSGIMVPPGVYKPLLRNRTASVMPVGTTLRFADYTDESDSPVAPSPAESPQGAIATGTGDTIYDAGLILWQLVSSQTLGLQIQRAGVTDATTANQNLILYHLHSVYIRDTAFAWRVWNGATWNTTTDPRETVQGTRLTTTSGSILDSRATAWQLVQGNPAQGLRVRHGSLTDSTNVLELLYWNHAVYRETTAGAWSRWDDATSAYVAVTANPRETTDATTISVVDGGPIYDARDVPWTLALSVTVGLQAQRDGVVDLATDNLVSLSYLTHTVYYQDVDGVRAHWTGTAWVIDPTAPIESAEATTVQAAGFLIYASRTPGTTSPPGNPLDTWGLTAAGGQIVHNGSIDSATSALISLYYHNHTVYQQATNGNAFGTPGWWYWDGATWVDVASPLPVAKSISIATIGQQTVGTSFTVSGILGGYGGAPTLNYQDNQTGSWLALPGGATVSATAFSFTHPAIATTQSAARVGLRDAGDTTVTALSNGFATVAAGVVTLTNVTLSGTTVAAGSAASTPVGNIAVTATGGTFAGSLSLGGTSAASFKIAGAQLQTNGVLAAGSYAITITATQAGATGSPLTRSFTITAQSISANVSVNMAALTGKTLSKYVFGVSSGALPDNSWNLLGNATFRTSMAQVKPTLVRVNANVPIVRLWNQGTTGVMDRWIQYKSQCFDPNVRLIMGVGPEGNDLTYSPSQWATWARDFAANMVSRGSPIQYWEVGNETDGKMAVATYNSYFNSIADALHGVDASYKVGGTTASWWGGTDVATFLASCASRLGFFCYHGYPVSPTYTNAQFYSTAAGNTDAANARTELRKVASVANVPLALNEYNMNGSPGADGFWGLAAQGTYVGAVFCALEMISQFKIDTNFEMGGLWDAALDDNYGIIGNHQQGGNLASIDTQGWYLGYAGQKLFGQEVTNSTTLSLTQVIATKNGTAFAIQLINYDTAAAKTAVIGLTGGAVSGTITRWEVGKSSPNAPTIGTQGSLTSVNIPSETIVILTGTLA